MKRNILISLFVLIFFTVTLLSSGCSHQTTLKKDLRIQNDIVPTNNISKNVATTDQMPTSSVNTVQEKERIFPIVYNNSEIFGFVKNKALLKEELINNKNASNYFSKGDLFKFYSLNGKLGTGKNPEYNIPEEIVQGATDSINMELDFKDERNMSGKDEAILRNVGLICNWDPMPRKIVRQSEEVSIYKDMIKETLNSKGYGDCKVEIKSILRFDIEGDGQDEALITASNHDYFEDELPNGNKYYSLVILRKIINDSVQNIVINEDYKTKTEENDMTEIHSYSTPIVLDIDGDGELEFFIEDHPNRAWFEISVVKLNGKTTSKIYSYILGA